MITNKHTKTIENGRVYIAATFNNTQITVTDEKGKASAVLIRAIEPLNFLGKCNGPGLLTKALKIGKGFHKKNIINNKEIWIENGNDESFEIMERFRIGVKKDLERPLRFYISDNKFVSRP